MPEFDELSFVTYFPYGADGLRAAEGETALAVRTGCRKIAMGLLLYILMSLLFATASAGATWWFVQRTMARQRSQPDQITRQSLQRLRSLACSSPRIWSE